MLGVWPWPSVMFEIFQIELENPILYIQWVLCCLCDRHLTPNICALIPSMSLYLSLSLLSHIILFCHLEVWSFTVHWHHFLSSFKEGKRREGERRGEEGRKGWKEKKRKEKGLCLPTLYPNIQPHHPSSCLFCPDMTTAKLSNTWKKKWK